MKTIKRITVAVAPWYVDDSYAELNIEVRTKEKGFICNRVLLVDDFQSTFDVLFEAAKQELLREIQNEIR